MVILLVLLRASMFGGTRGWVLMELFWQLFSDPLCGLLQAIRYAAVQAESEQSVPIASDAMVEDQAAATETARPPVVFCGEAAACPDQLMPAADSNNLVGNAMPMRTHVTDAADDSASLAMDTSASEPEVAGHVWYCCAILGPTRCSSSWPLAACRPQSDHEASDQCPLGFKQCGNHCSL